MIRERKNKRYLINQGKERRNSYNDNGSVDADTSAPNVGGVAPFVEEPLVEADRVEVEAKCALDDSEKNPLDETRELEDSIRLADVVEFRVEFLDYITVFVSHFRFQEFLVNVLIVQSLLSVVDVFFIDGFYHNGC